MRCFMLNFKDRLLYRIDILYRFINLSSKMICFLFNSLSLIINIKMEVFLIGEFGLKIKNIEASTLYEYNIGIRDHYDYKEAMFTNSLFFDFLMENGMTTWKEESTRDIICLEFNFGTRSYEQEIEHITKIAHNARNEYKLAKSLKNKNEIEKKYNKRKKIQSLYLEAKKNKDKYKKISKEEIRRIFYNDGVNVEYVSRKKDGTIKKVETIHYKMLYRSTGKAKKGSCMFIRDKLYKKAKDFLYMGIKLSKKNPMIVEISAYAPLVSSTIVDKIKINPRNILILEDIDRFFTTDVVSIETNENKECIAKHIQNYKLKNTLFDGQALIDSSIFPSWGNGYILLRHHFTKMAAFCAHIQDFFKDYFGDKYDTATVLDMFGNEHYVKDIQLITTDNAVKWLKFDKTYDYWCNKVEENGCNFGIVKTAHESKLGSVQKMSYQMVNSLDESIMQNVMKESVQYVERLKQDDDFFLEYLKKNSNFSNDYEVLIALCEQDRDFLRSSYFRHRKRKIIEAYVLNMKTGKIIQNAENLVIVGSPYAMLLYGATGNKNIVDEDPTFNIEENTIQCYTERFEDGDYLAFFRSPFNSKNNLTYLHNHKHELLKKYFEFGEQIVAVNLNGTDFQDRNNGSDQDSDSGYCTNQSDIVEHARQCYLNYHTIVNNIPKDKNVYENTMDDYAKIDNALAGSQRDIGESSNLAQMAQTYACNFSDQKYIDYVCILSVLAQVAIDNAKRRFDIDLAGEIRRIKKDLDIKENKYPSFWRLIRRDTKFEKINWMLKCPMNCLYDVDLSKSRDNSPTLSMDVFFQKFELEQNRKTCKKVEELIQKYSLKTFEYNTSDDDSYRDEQYLLLRNDFNDLINNIQRIYLSGNYIGLMSWLIDRAFMITPNINSNYKVIQTKIHTNKAILLKVLYQVNSTNLLKIFAKNVQN